MEWLEEKKEGLERQLLPLWLSECEVDQSALNLRLALIAQLCGTEPTVI